MLLSILISSLHRSTTSSSPLTPPLPAPPSALPGLDSLTLSLLLVAHPPAARAGCLPHPAPHPPRPPRITRPAPPQRGDRHLPIFAMVYPVATAARPCRHTRPGGGMADALA
ncbi:exported hypothetical protein [Actinacidiphila bryophytorum]|uniref:Uncharacterized protein n=1 Tax=Actinacidiphila bryophytorum TaxID=1436133 RepID=A0A9W4MK62_9ACTN|nr:exported hypothetical protein [Actinacidiphila bryophytorum]